MLSEVATIYLRSKKRVDINWFTEWLCRPFAAFIVYALRKTPVTPNQVSFFSLAITLGGAALAASTQAHSSIMWAALLFHISFLFDCADGMLARERSQSSELGHLLDFLMDEVKALLVYGSITIYLARKHADPNLLMWGLGGLIALSVGLRLTAFMRRPEYSGQRPDKDGQPAQTGGRSGVLGMALNILEHAARSVVHYPQYLWFLAIFDRVDLYFWGYGAVQLLYVGRAGLQVFVRLGRF